MNDVVREPGCPVSPFGTRVKYSVIAMSENASAENETGSEIAAAPCAIDTDSCPSKRSETSVVGSIVPLALPVARAMWADETHIGPSPNSFDNRNRHRVPPSDGWITCRKVVPESPGVGGI